MEIGIMSYDLAFHRPFLIDQNRWFNDLELRLECLDKLKEYQEGRKKSLFDCLKMTVLKRESELIYRHS